MFEKSCFSSHSLSSSVSGMSILSILKITGLVPSLQQAIIMRSSLVHPCMMEPPCSAVYTYLLMASHASLQNLPSSMR